MTLRVAVLVSGQGTNLRALLEAKETEKLDIDFTLVLSDKPDAPALSFARQHGVPTCVIPYRGKEERAAWDEELLQALKKSNSELIVLAGFMRIVGPALVRGFAGRIINVHPSLLPAFPGLNAPQQALDAGVSLSGCTVHVVDEGVDSGPILAQGAAIVCATDDLGSLHARIQQVEHHLLPRVVQAIANGDLSLLPRPQWKRQPVASSETLCSPPWLMK